MSTERFKVWFVEDFMSKEVIDNRYFTTKEEAVKYRNEICYGIVRFHDVAMD